MPIKVTCSNCGGVLHAPDDAGGKRGRCPTCGNILPIPADAGRSSAGHLPEPPAPAKGGRSPSFGDFAIGPSVGAPPGGAPESIPIGAVSPHMPSPAARASSVPSLADPKPDPRKASALPGPSDKTEPRRAADPFARRGTGGGGDWQPAAAAPGVAKAWRKARSGLWWVGAAAFFFVTPALALPGLQLAEHFTKKSLFTTETFPVLKLPQSTAIPLLIAVVPILLGLLCLLIGRLGFSNAPRRSGVKGPALLAVLATIVTLAGGLAVGFPSVAYLLSPDETAPGGGQAGTPDEMPLYLFGPEGPAGVIQRFGILLGLAALLVGEFWFASAVGRVGSALAHGPTAARATRYSLLLGLFVLVTVGVGGVLATDFGFGGGANEMSREAAGIVKTAWVTNLNPLLDKLGEYRPLLKPGLILGGGLLLGLIYWRLIRAPRAAIREWLDRNPA